MKIKKYIAIVTLIFTSICYAENWVPENERFRLDKDSLVFLGNPTRVVFDTKYISANGGYTITKMGVLCKNGKVYSSAMIIYNPDGTISSSKYFKDYEEASDVRAGIPLMVYREYCPHKR